MGLVSMQEPVRNARFERKKKFRREDIQLLMFPVMNVGCSATDVRASSRLSKMRIVSRDGR
jgi:hypothetical protein